jgi:hypothetical protein
MFGDSSPLTVNDNPTSSVVDLFNVLLTQDTSSALQPKLYRNDFDTKKILEHEQDIRVEFRRRGAQLITERQPIDKWEWYFLMQHHRASTRLLDWSDAALVALVS